MASLVPVLTKKKLVNGTIDLDTDTFKIMLCTSTFAPNQDTIDFRNAVTNEVSGTGYTAGGLTLAGLAFTDDVATNHRTAWSFTAPVWSTATITARWAVIYKSRGGASSADEVILCIDFATDKTSTAGSFTITPDATGVIQIT